MFSMAAQRSKSGHHDGIHPKAPRIPLFIGFPYTCFTVYRRIPLLEQGYNLDERPLFLANYKHLAISMIEHDRNPPAPR